MAQRLAQPLARRLLSGINLRKVENGTGSRRFAVPTGLSGNERTNPVKSVARFLTRLFARMAKVLSTVLRRAKPVHVVSVKILTERAPVYCLEVPDVGHFALANGEIVHNCSHAADAFGYMAVALKEERQAKEHKTAPEPRRMLTRTPGGDWLNN